MKQKLTLLFLVIASILFAQEGEKKAYSFTLQQAIEQALKNNYKVINAERDIESAIKKRWEITASGLPQIRAGLDYNNNFAFTLQGVSGNAFNPGGDPNEISTIAFGTKNSMNARASLSQLIFDGTYIVALQASKTYLKFYQNSKDKTDQEVKEMVINAYGNVLLAEESILILGKNKGILEKTLFDTKETFKNGLIEEENVEQLQITLASLTSSLENVKRQKRIAVDVLKLLLGIDLMEELVLIDQLNTLTQNNIDLVLLKKEFEAKTLFELIFLIRLYFSFISLP